MGVVTAVLPTLSTEGRAWSQQVHRIRLLGNPDTPEHCRVASVRPARTRLLPSSVQGPPSSSSHRHRNLNGEACRAGAPAPRVCLPGSKYENPPTPTLRKSNTQRTGWLGGNAKSGLSRLPNSRA